MKWISFEDKMPEILTNIIFYHKDNISVMFGMFFPNGVHVAGDVYKCSHWMPLPEPPK